MEHPEQVEFLRGIGCDYVQGYVFHRPMPQADYEHLLEEDMAAAAAYAQLQTEAV